ncbi:hypothetical protein L6452_43080 [Arctium lappa]|uniref:Uncharacterized protein n=1 Tax=Arctium lappa TaxID=4217 RepID=A0ACB8XKT1_ARCLA|nr:hypothetical protein L6452_43080 [Arctium lappa]
MYSILQTWGGVVVLNPPNYLGNANSMHPLRSKVSPQELNQILEVFMGQLQQLFGLKSTVFYKGASGSSILLASERGFTEWQRLQLRKLPVGSVVPVPYISSRLATINEVGVRVQSKGVRRRVERQYVLGVSGVTTKRAKNTQAAQQFKTPDMGSVMGKSDISVAAAAAHADEEEEEEVD